MNFNTEFEKTYCNDFHRRWVFSLVAILAFSCYQAVMLQFFVFTTIFGNFSLR